MMENWNKKKLTDIGVLVQTGPFGSQLHEADYSNAGIPVVMPKDIKNGKITETTTAKIEEQIYNRLKRHTLKIGDIVLPRRGDFNKRAIIGIKEKGWICGTGCIKVTTNPKILLPKFLYFYLSLDTTVDYIENQAVGSTMLNLSATIVQRFEIPLPPLSIQQKIADILGKYDALIENSEQQISILETTAKQIYREWFVRGRCPFGENREEKPLFEIAEITYGFPFDSTLFNEENEGKPVVRIRDIKANSIKTYTTETANEKYFLSDGDLIIGMDGEFHISRWTNGEAWLNQRVVRLRPKNNIISQSFLHYAAQPVIEFLNSIISGTTVAHLSDQDLKKITIAIPNDDVMFKFKKITDSIFEKQLNLKKQIASLRRTRDALLPRLLSGRLILPETEQTDK